MKKYKVIALSVGAMSNKIFRSGDIVSENAFPPGHAEELVKDGFLEPVTEKKMNQIEGQPEDVDKAKTKREKK